MVIMCFIRDHFIFKSIGFTQRFTRSQVIKFRTISIFLLKIKTWKPKQRVCLNFVSSLSVKMHRYFRQIRDMPLLNELSDVTIVRESILRHRFTLNILIHLWKNIPIACQDKKKFQFHHFIQSILVIIFNYLYKVGCTHWNILSSLNILYVCLVKRFTKTRFACFYRLVRTHTDIQGFTAFHREDNKWHRHYRSFCSLYSR